MEVVVVEGVRGGGVERGPDQRVGGGGGRGGVVKREPDQRDYQLIPMRSM